MPNIVHLYQTAERIRERYPDNDWFQLTGLVHDLGKLMALFGEPQVNPTHARHRATGRQTGVRNISFIRNTCNICVTWTAVTASLAPV